MTQSALPIALSENRPESGRDVSSSIKHHDIINYPNQQQAGRKQKINQAADGALGRSKECASRRRFRLLGSILVDVNGSRGRNARPWLLKMLISA